MTEINEISDSTTTTDGKNENSLVPEDAVDDGISSASSSDIVDGEQQKPAAGDSSEQSTAEWEDILGSNELMRKVIRPGTGDAKAVTGDLVTIRVEGQLENGQRVDCHEELSFLLGHSEVISSWDLCVPFMKVGEINSLRTSPRFAYGKVGKDNEIPPDAALTYEIELLSVENGPDFSELSVTDLLTWIDRKKDRGNYYFKREDYASAIDVYNRTLNILNMASAENEDDRRRLADATATVYNNLAASQLKVKAWSAAVASLRQCLSTQPKNVKAQFRLGKAYMGQEEYDLAISVYKDALAMDPDNKAIQRELEHAKFMLKSETQRTKAMYKRMFADPLTEDNGKDISSLDWWRNHSIFASGAVLTAVAVAAGAVLFRFYAPRA